MSKTREEKRRDRNWFLARLAVFIVCMAAFLLILVGTECLAEAVLTQISPSAAISEGNTPQPIRAGIEATEANENAG